MEKRQLGTSDLEVTKICLGTMTWGHQNTEQQAHEQLNYAIHEQGINFIDTAEVYAIPPQPDTQGSTETYIGNWLADQKREDLIIASKITGKNFDRVRNNEGYQIDSISKALEGSLSRLQTDYIDLYQLHRPERDVQLWGKHDFEGDTYDTTKNGEEQFVAILHELKKHINAGKIRYIGLSNETSRGTMKYLQLAKDYGLPVVQTIQNAYNLVRRDFDSSLMEVCLRENVSLLGYSPLAGGILSGKYQNGAKPVGARYSTRGASRMPQYVQERVFAATDKYITLADELGISVAQLAIAWVNDRPAVGSNIIGATTMNQLKECISTADITLSPQTLKKIDAIHGEQFNPACF